jgi:hypothetical protein
MDRDDLDKAGVDKDDLNKDALHKDDLENVMGPSPVTVRIFHRKV